MVVVMISNTTVEATESLQAKVRQARLVLCCLDSTFVGSCT